MSQEGHQLMKDMPLIRYHLLILWVLPLGRQILYSDTTMCHKEKHYKHRNHSMLQLSNLKLKKMASYQENPCLLSFELHHAASGEFTECISNTPFSHKQRMTRHIDHRFNENLTIHSTPLGKCQIVAVHTTFGCKMKFPTLHCCLCWNIIKKSFLNFCFFSLHSVKMIRCNFTTLLVFFLCEVSWKLFDEERKKKSVV